MTITSERGQEMLTYLPRLVRDSIIYQALLEAQGQEFDSLRAAVEWIGEQAFVRTADEVGLALWENFVGLTPEPALNNADRADRVVGRLRGYGTATKGLIESIVNAYSSGTCVVEDVSDNPAAAVPDYTIRITYITPTGIPDTHEDVVEAVRHAAPAHLDIVYVYNYTIFGEIWAHNWTIGQMEGSQAGGPAGAPLTIGQWEVYE